MHVLPSKTVGRIPQLKSVGCAQPVDVEGYRSLYGRSIFQGIADVMVVLYVEPADMQGARSLSEMHVQAALRKGNRPEKAVFCNAGIEVVDLCGVHRTLKDVESNKDKGISVYSPVFPDIDTPHEAHIHIEGHCLGRMSVCVRLRALASHVGDPDHAIEVGDCGRLKTRGWQENVEYFCSWAKRLNAARDRLGGAGTFPSRLRH